ncbi:MAG: RibD family protein [Thermodesulfobacteriota bacterium]
MDRPVLVHAVHPVHAVHCALAGVGSLPALAARLQAASGLAAALGRPLVILSYAQSLDGSIASRQRRPLALSGESSLRFTHGLRALCDAILVGIETVLADNPRLTVRLVPGASPRPVVLDTRLRTPLAAALLADPGRRPLIAAGRGCGNGRADELSRAGARVLHSPVAADGRVELAALLPQLLGLGIHTLMVEGGARVITSFLASGLVDLLAVTVAPKLVGGLPALDRPLAAAGCLELAGVRVQQLGPDLVIWAQPGQGL